jgi:hypothetical protein
VRDDGLERFAADLEFALRPDELCEFVDAGQVHPCQSADVLREIAFGEWHCGFPQSVKRASLFVKRRCNLPPRSVI